MPRKHATAVAPPATDGRLAYGLDEIHNIVPVGRSTLYQEIAAGRLRAFKCRGRTLVTRHALEAWVAVLEGESGSKPEGDAAGAGARP